MSVDEFRAALRKLIRDAMGNDLEEILVILHDVANELEDFAGFVE
jgi:hypothetical protein